MAISSGLGSSALLPAGLGFRNVLINGGMDVWQRGTSSVAPANGAMTNTDRWVHTGVTTTFTQQTDVPAGFRYSLGVSGSDPSFAQKIEAANSARLANQTVTFSIWAKSVSGSTSLFVNFYYPSAVDNFASLTTISSTTISTSVSSSWSRYTLTVNLPANVVNGLMVLVGRSAGASNTYYTGIQLEQNYQPTPFEQRPIGVELALCQRYYEKSYDYLTAIGTATSNNTIMNNYGSFSGFHYAAGSFQQVKRAVPTFRAYSNSGAADAINVVGYGDAVYGAVIGTHKVRCGVGVVTGTGVQFQYTADAEL